MLPLPVPASVYGLVLLLAALTAGVVKLEQVKETGTYLTGIFPLLFVPAAAGIMELWAEMGQLLLPILIAILPVTVLVMAAAGRTTQALTARNKKEEADHDLRGIPAALVSLTSHGATGMGQPCQRQLIPVPEAIYASRRGL